MSQSVLSKDAVKLLRMVKAQILKEPRQFDMALYFLPIRLGRKIPNCGTAACIGGWMVALSEGVTPAAALESYGHSQEGVAQAAKMLLGKGVARYAAADLFHEYRWPTRYYRQFLSARSLKGRAAVAARRIEAFIREHSK